MPDNFEKAKDEILYRTKGNGGPTTRDLLIAIGALAQDVDEMVTGLDERQHKRHTETVGEVRELCRRVGEVETWRSDVEVGCPAKIDEAIEKGVEIAVERATCKHDLKHEQFVEQLEERFSQKRRNEDPVDDDWTRRRSTLSSEADKQVWFMWMVGSKLGYILIAVIITAINIVLNILWFGTP